MSIQLGKRILGALSVVVLLPALAAAQAFLPPSQPVPIQAVPQGSREEQIILDASTVLSEIMAVPAKQIPHHLLKEAYGIAVVPGVVKGSFVVGVRHGRGVVLIRDADGNWQAPIFVSLTGGSFGWQVGLQSTDVILVFKSPKSVAGLMNGKLTIGVDAAAAAGPVGRNAAAATDARLQAEILSYSRSRGLFAGVSIDGSSIQVDRNAGAAYYRQFQVGPEGQVVQTAGVVPPSAVQLVNQLTAYTGGAFVPEGNAAPGAFVPDESSPAVSVELGEPAAEPPAGVAAAQQPAYANTSQAALESSMNASLARLLPLVDPQWRQYLALPPLGGDTPQYDASAWRAALARYDRAAADPRYRALTERAEFLATHRLVRDYIALRAQRDGVIELPPPPEK